MTGLSSPPERPDLWALLRAHGPPAGLRQWTAAGCPRCGVSFPIAPACVAPCVAAIPPGACRRCAQPAVRGAACASLGCARGWNAIRRTDVVLGYKQGNVERLVLAAKRVEPWAVAALARILAGWLLEVAAPRAYDVVLPVPFHRAALRGRPAHPLTAIYLHARPAVWPRLPADDLAPALLVRTVPHLARRAQSEWMRWRSVRGTVALAFPTRGLRGARALLIDDVLTSGATVSECARVLLEDGGAAAVDAAVLTRQPWRAAAPSPDRDGPAYPRPARQRTPQHSP